MAINLDWSGEGSALRHSERNLNNREIRLTAVMQKPESELPKCLAISDSKSIYGNLTREQFTGAEKRSALEICVIRDSLYSMDGEIRWVPHEKNAVDCLTKVKGNMESLLDLMKAARYTLVGEEQEMRKRAAYRAATGKANPRAKRSGIAHDAEPTDSVSAFNRTFPDEGVDHSFCTSHPSTFINWGVTYSEEWTESDASSRSPPNCPPPSSSPSLIARW